MKQWLCYTHTFNHTSKGEHMNWQYTWVKGGKKIACLLKIVVQKYFRFIYKGLATS